MHCISVFDNCDLPPEIIPSVEMPTIVHGRSISWDTDYAPVVVFIKSFSWKTSSIHLFGTRLAFSRSSERRTGQTIEYIVGTLDANPVFSQLAQGNDIVFASADWTGGWKNAAECKKQSLEFSLELVPRWKWNDAQWPTLDGQLMTFIGQVSLPRNKVTEEYLTYYDTVYLFASQQGDKLVFAIMCQMTSYQSADDHYRDEAKRMSRTKSSKKRTAKKRKGDE